jgi:hypothetical protein
MYRSGAMAATASTAATAAAGMIRVVRDNEETTTTAAISIPIRAPNARTVRVGVLVR